MSIRWTEQKIPIDLKYKKAIIVHSYLNNTRKYGSWIKLNQIKVGKNIFNQIDARINIKVYLQHPSISRQHRILHHEKRENLWYTTPNVPLKVYSTTFTFDTSFWTIIYVLVENPWMKRNHLLEIRISIVNEWVKGSLLTYNLIYYYRKIQK